MNSPAPAATSTAHTAELARTFDLRRLDASFYANPYPIYDALRTHEPIKRMPDGSLFLTRYRDIRPSIAMRRRSAPTRPRVRAEIRRRRRSLRITRRASSSTTRRATRACEADPGALTRTRSRRWSRDWSPSSTACSIGPKRAAIDLIDDFASAIPVEVIGNLLDVPHEGRGPLRDWSLAILGALEPSLTPEQQRAAIAR